MSTGRLYYGDNLDVLREHVDTESVDLVYLDPPFNSNRNYNVIFARHDTEPDADRAQIQAFDDTWRWTPVTEDQYRDAVAGGLPSRVADALSAMRTLVGENDAMAYLMNMAPRLVELHRVLKRTGSLYLHCDPTMSHYLKLLLDAIFGPEHFRNEIAWKRTGSHNDARRYAKVQDTILYYGKSAYVTWNRQFTPPSEKYLASHYNREDEHGRRYRLDNIIRSASMGPRPNLSYEYRGFTPKWGWRMVPEKLEQLDRAGKLTWSKSGTPYLVRYLDEMPGSALTSIWDDIPPINSQAAERLGYQTQKPLELLRRIVRASSTEGDVVLDPFCGCGTTIDAAVGMDRDWIGIDITTLAVDLIQKRLIHTYGSAIVGTFQVRGIPRDLAGARALFHRSPFEFERWAVSLVNATPNQKQVGDRGIDGVVRFYTDAEYHTGRVLVSVKGGKSIGPQYVRDLIGTVGTERAEMGTLLTLAPLTSGIMEAVDRAGNYHWPVNGQPFPVAQALTVDDLITGRRRLNAPPSVNPYIAADRRRQPFDQLVLDMG